MRTGRSRVFFSIHPAPAGPVFYSFGNGGGRYALFETPHIIHQAPDVLVVRDFLFKTRHFPFAFVRFIKQGTVCLLLKQGGGKITRRRVQLCSFGTVTEAGFAMTRGAVFRPQRLTGGQRIFICFDRIGLAVGTFRYGPSTGLRGGFWRGLGGGFLFHFLRFWGFRHCGLGSGFRLFHNGLGSFLRRRSRLLFFNNRCSGSGSCCFV